MQGLRQAIHPGKCRRLVDGARTAYGQRRHLPPRKHRPKTGALGTFGRCTGKLARGEAGSGTPPYSDLAGRMTSA